MLFSDQDARAKLVILMFCVMSIPRYFASSAYRVPNSFSASRK